MQNVACDHIKRGKNTGAVGVSESEGWIVLKWMYIDPFCLSDFWSRLKCKWEEREVRLSSWHSDKCPSAIMPQTPFQQFHSDYTTHPVTFTSEHGPRMQKVSNFWTEPPLHQLLSMPGRTERVHLDFLPVSSLLLFAVTLENGAQQFSPCCHLDSAVPSPPTQV